MKLRQAMKLMWCDRYWRVPLHTGRAAARRLGKWFLNRQRQDRQANQPVTHKRR